MKKAGRWFSAHLLAGFYALGVALTLLCCLFAFVWDSIGYATGRLFTETVSLDTITVQDILQTEDGVWVSSGSDPQILLSSAQPIRSVIWDTAQPVVQQQGEGYYAPNGADFSLRRRVWAKAAGDGTTGMELDFPLSGGNTVRIDPAGAAGVVLAAGDAPAALIINAPRSFASYFALGAEDIFWLLLLPAVAAAAADWGRSSWQGYKAARQQKGAK